MECRTIALARSRKAPALFLTQGHNGSFTRVAKSYVASLSSMGKHARKALTIDPIISLYVWQGYDREKIFFSLIMKTQPSPFFLKPKMNIR